MADPQQIHLISGQKGASSVMALTDLIPPLFYNESENFNVRIRLEQSPSRDGVMGCERRSISQVLATVVSWKEVMARL